MFKRSFRSLVGAVAVFSILGGCAHSSTIGGGENSNVSETPIYRVNEFCAQNEWFCILAGLAAFGGTVAIIASTGGDSDSQSP
jgi:hypothetical protein